jgi:hypothetical protein
MRELQAEIHAKEATPEQREAARRELARLLKSPAAKSPASGEGRGLFADWNLLHYEEAQRTEIIAEKPLQ